MQLRLTLLQKHFRTLASAQPPLLQRSRARFLRNGPQRNPIVLSNEAIWIFFPFSLSLRTKVTLVGEEELLGWSVENAISRWDQGNVCSTVKNRAANRVPQRFFERQWTGEFVWIYVLPFEIYSRECRCRLRLLQWCFVDYYGNEWDARVFFSFFIKKIFAHKFLFLIYIALIFVSCVRFFSLS